jgi:membrane protein
MNIVAEAKQKGQVVEQQVNRVDIPQTRRLGLWDLLSRTFSRMGDYHLGAFAGNLAYQGLFSIFPFLVFLISLLGLFHATSLVNSAIAQIGTAMPAQAVSLLHQINRSVTQSRSSGAFTIGAIISILAALWGVSGGFRAVMEAMNVMYGVKETRPFWRVYLVSIVMAVAVSALLIAAVVLVVFGAPLGAALAGQLGFGQVFQTVWQIVRWPVLLGFVLVAFALIYYAAPNAKQKLKFLPPGTTMAVALWLVFSLLFSLYVNNFGSYNKTYGTLAGIAIFLLYLYYSAFIVLLGGVMNRIIEEHAPDSHNYGGKVQTKGEQDSAVQGNRTLQILKESRPAREPAQTT